MDKKVKDLEEILPGFLLQGKLPTTGKKNVTPSCFSWKKCLWRHIKRNLNLLNLKNSALIVALHFQTIGVLQI